MCAEGSGLVAGPGAGAGGAELMVELVGPGTLEETQETRRETKNVGPGKGRETRNKAKNLYT